MRFKLMIGAAFFLLAILISLVVLYAGSAQAGEREHSKQLDLVVQLAGQRWPGVPLFIRSLPAKDGAQWSAKPAPLTPLGTCDDQEDCEEAVEEMCELLGAERDEDVEVEYGPSQTGGYLYCEGQCDDENGTQVVAICNFGAGPLAT